MTDNLTTSLVKELTHAEKIILVMLKHMTGGQKDAADDELTNAGVSPEGMTRYAERRAVLDRAAAQAAFTAAIHADKKA